MTPMTIARIETHYPGRSWSTVDLKDALSERDRELSFAHEALGLGALVGEPGALLERPEFFTELGVERRNIQCDPRTPGRFWHDFAGTDPFAQQGAIAYEAMMREEEPLGPEDRVIVVGNGDTVAPNLAYGVLAKLQERRDGFVQPTALALAGEGCSGYVSGLREAGLYLASNPCARVVVLTIEIMATGLFHPSLHRQLVDHALVTARHGDERARRVMAGRLKSLCVQRYLFGEGCSATLCLGRERARGRRGWVPESMSRWANLSPMDRHLLEQVATLTKEAPHYTPFGFFSQKPRQLMTRLATDYLPRVCVELAGLDPRPAHWAIHTGSSKILEVVGARMGLDRQAIEPSREVLRERGNMNATTGAAILTNHMAAGHEGVFAMFFGLGFALQTCWLRRARRGVAA